MTRCDRLKGRKTGPLHIIIMEQNTNKWMSIIMMIYICILFHDANMAMVDSVTLFVNEGSGSDSLNDGLSSGSPSASLTRAFDLARASVATPSDIIYVTQGKKIMKERFNQNNNKNHMLLAKPINAIR